MPICDFANIHFCFGYIALFFQFRENGVQLDSTFFYVAIQFVGFTTFTSYTS